MNRYQQKRDALKSETIHIFYSEEHPNGYTVANTNREACAVAVELMSRVKVPVSVIGGMKHWKTGKYAYWIVEINEPFRTGQLSGGYTAQPVII